jgi:hypothetical protein
MSAAVFITPYIPVNMLSSLSLSLSLSGSKNLFKNDDDCDTDSDSASFTIRLTPCVLLLPFLRGGIHHLGAETARAQKIDDP